MVVPIPLWPDIGAQGNTRAAPAVCSGCWGERVVILLPWWLHHLTACPRHRVLLRQRCAGCAEPLWLTAGRGDCARCGAVIGAMGTRSIAGDADGIEVSALVWRATGCVEGLYPPEELGLAPDHPAGGVGAGARPSGAGAEDAGAAAGPVGRRADGGSRGRGAAAARAGDSRDPRGAHGGVALAARRADARAGAAVPPRRGRPR